VKSGTKARKGNTITMHSFWQHWHHFPIVTLRIYKHMEGINRLIEVTTVFFSEIEPGWEDSADNLGSYLAVPKPFPFAKLKTIE
jgi:hypothetical protein